MPIAFVAVGGIAGALARYGLSSWILQINTTRFPWGTFVVNILGCFLLGIAGSLLAERAVGEHDFVRYAISVGFLGSFTTFSTFQFETLKLLESDAWPIAVAYVGSSVVIGLIAARLGISVFRAFS